ncbi:MAG: hypothetical protein Hyperionvirus2_55 [Hyperionvirus sp.]|uniref:Uncharacterized protein n=1 Tax=Hyperionvirus sp. TaxID=2487770 RepID=A0A3G5A627_9VIRU|nr:MAG: hypothetical protein Hyperionvirus2_55 [Hyperionvirus sp.]
MSLQSVDSAIDEAEDLVSDELIVMGITLKTDIDNERKHAVKNFKYLLIAGFFRLTQAVIFAATLQSCAVGKIVPLFINTGITTILALIFWYRINTSCRGKKPYERAIETQALINKYGTFDEL